MREILFRGKRLDDGEWVEGWYQPETTIKHWDGSQETVGVTIAYKVEDGFLEDTLVDPLTVGQYTGMTDKNGKRIFEGDIVRYTFDSPDDPTATENGLKVRTGRIFWSDWRASFAVTAGRNLSAALNNDVAVYVRGRQVYEYVRGANTVEVIGNIHHNPEMLKGGEG